MPGRTSRRALQDSLPGVRPARKLLEGRCFVTVAGMLANPEVPGQRAPARDAPRVVLVCDDLLLRSRLEPLIAAAGARAEVGSGAAALLAAGAEGPAGTDAPSAFVVDLSLRRSPAAATISDLRARFPNTPIVAFGPHTDRASLAEAAALGCHAVLARSRAVRELPEILRELLARS